MISNKNLHLETIRVPRSWSKDKELYREYVQHNLYYLFTTLRADFRFVQMDSDDFGRGVFACFLPHSGDWFVIYGDCNADGLIINGDRAHLMHNLSDKELSNFSSTMAHHILSVSF